VTRYGVWISRGPINAISLNEMTFRLPWKKVNSFVLTIDSVKSEHSIQILGWRPSTGGRTASSIIRSKASQPHFLDRWFCVPSLYFPSPFYHSCWRSSHLYLDAAQGPLPRWPKGLANCYTANCIMNSFTPIALHLSHLIYPTDFYIYSSHNDYLIDSGRVIDTPQETPPRTATNSEPQNRLITIRLTQHNKQLKKSFLSIFSGTEILTLMYLIL
jgi:hypothetical protein